MSERFKHGRPGEVLRVDQPVSLHSAPIPDYVLRALSSWHECAIVYDPANPSQQASERAVTVWQAFENACLQWERQARAERRHFGPTGTA